MVTVGEVAVVRKEVVILALKKRANPTNVRANEVVRLAVRIGTVDTHKIFQMVGMVRSMVSILRGTV